MADDHEDSSSSEDGFKINEAYAQKYDEWRRKEELQKLKDKYGTDIVEELESSSSSSSSEDEDAEALTPHIEKAWLRAYAAVKTKHPKIYEKQVNFFESDDSEESDSESNEDTAQKGKAKPVFLKDYERKFVLEKGGKYSDEENENDDQEIRPGPSYYEEQDEIRKSFQTTLGDDDSDSDDGGLLTKRKKTEEEERREEDDYVEWLKGHKSTLEDEQAGIELDPLRDYWNDPKLDEKEKFLRDYVLNKRYVDDEDHSRIPTYNELVDEVEFSDEENMLEKQETFERKYNFRFEEPDPEFIKSYPRTIKETVRRKDEKRKLKRQEIRERKIKEKEKKKEELKQLKNLKKKEILSKLDKLKEITGNPNVGFNEDDLDGDFDPAEYDRKMQCVFSEDYYDECGDDSKPVFDDDEELGLDEENWDDYHEEYEGEEHQPHCEDDDFIMDCDYDPSQHVSKKAKKMKKSKLAEALAQEKPQFDPDDKTFEEYFDEYYKLDYEDIIDDLPCRFKYRQVPANDFGLSTDEVFKCRDKELNAWVSLKKMSQYRTEEEEQYDISVYRSKGRNQRKKMNVLTSLREEEEGADRRGKKGKAPAETVTKASLKQQKKKQKGEKRNATELPKSQSPNKKQKSAERTKDESSSPKKKNLFELGVEKDSESYSKFASPKKSVSNSENVSLGAKSDIRESDELSESNTTESDLDDSPKKNKPDDMSGQKNEPDNTSGQKSGTVSTTGGGSQGKRKRKRKKKRNRKGGVEGSQAQGGSQTQVAGPCGVTQTQGAAGGKAKKQRVKKPVVSDERLKAYGINPKKFKYMDLQRPPKPRQTS